METQSQDTVEKLLVQKLKSLGVEVEKIPYVIRDIDHSFVNNPSMNLEQVNECLINLGWNDLSLDYRTYELAKEYFENNSMMKL